MKFLSQLVLFFLVCVYSAFGKKEIIIKYSIDDCIFCSMPLFSLRNVANDIPVNVVFKKEELNNEKLSDIKKQIQDNRFNISYSDSIYYAIDSSERSMIYIYEGGNVIYSDYLKDFKPVPALFRKGKGNIIFPNLVSIRHNKDNIYLLGSYNYILKVKKNNPEKVNDTLQIITPDLKEKLFQKYYGDNYHSKLDSLEELYKMYPIPKTFRIADAQVSNDSMWVMVTTGSFEKNLEELHVTNLPFLILFVKDVMRDIVPINHKYSNLTSNSIPVGVTSNFFIRDNEAFYLSLTSNGLASNNPVMCKMELNSGKLRMKSKVNYDLDTHLVNTKVGYMMNDVLYSNGFVSNQYSSDIFQLSESKLIHLNISHDSNDFTLSQVKNLKHKVNYKILNFYYNKNVLHVVYNNRSTLMYARYEINKGNAKQILEKLLTTTYPEKDKFNRSLVCDDFGIYSYSYENDKFNFYPY